MRLSIVIACLNSERVILRCLQSIEDQICDDDIEVVIADGGSADRTTEAIESFARSSRAPVVWASERDSGIADAWNKAIRRATGDWLLFLGSDDALADSSVVAQAMPVLRSAFPGHRIVYGNVAMCSPDGEPLELLEQPWTPDEFRNCLRCLPHQGVFHHRTLFDHGQCFDTTLTMVSDYDFLLRELMTKEPLHIPDLTVTRMQIGGLTTSRRNVVKLITEHRQLYRRHVGGFSRELQWRLVKATIIEFLFRVGGDRAALWATNQYRRALRRTPPLNY
jgi:glycosyltransferase involved in cell wall biosynthesis